LNDRLAAEKLSRVKEAGVSKIPRRAIEQHRSRCETQGRCNHVNDASLVSDNDGGTAKRSWVGVRLRCQWAERLRVEACDKNGAADRKAQRPCSDLCGHTGISNLHTEVEITDCRRRAKKNAGTAETEARR